MRAVILCTGCLLPLVSSYGQNAKSWPCSDDLTKVEGDNRRVRVNVSVTQAMARDRVLPDVSDLRGAKTNSAVVLRVLIGKDGAVRCVDPVQGDTTLLFPRSVEAAKKWRFQPYLLNGQPIVVDTTIEFEFKKGKVTAR